LIGIVNLWRADDEKVLGEQEGWGTEDASAINIYSPHVTVNLVRSDDVTPGV